LLLARALPPGRTRHPGILRMGAESRSEGSTEAEEAWAFHFSSQESALGTAEAAADFLAGNIPLAAGEGLDAGVKRAGSGIGSWASRGAEAAAGNGRLKEGQIRVVEHMAAVLNKTGAS